MNAPATPAQAGRTVFDLMRGASLRIALLSMLVVGAVLTAGTGLLLHVSTQSNLLLQARALAYSVEAAVVFRDASAAESLLRDQLMQAPIAAASVALGTSHGPAAGPQPDDFVYVSRPASARTWDALLGRLWRVHAQAPIVAQGEQVGEVRLQADASQLLRLLALAAAGVLAAMVVAGLAVLRMARQLASSLVRPLHALAEHTRRMSHQREQRTPAPRSGLVELDRLSADFDALLDDLARHEQEIQRQHNELLGAHHRMAAQLREDALTGAASRLHFEESLALAIEQAEAEQGCLSLYFIDADNFKDVNDRYGHDAGDQVLEAIARRLRSRVRDEDLVGRLGGDEFVVLVRGQRLDTSSPGLDQQLHDAVAQPLALPDGTVIVPSVSVGCALYPADGTSMGELISFADQNMYRHKRLRATQPIDRDRH
jgi:diguanylate cyclase (GGDEF)-like protein